MNIVFTPESDLSYLWQQCCAGCNRFADGQPPLFAELGSPVRLRDREHHVMLTCYGSHDRRVCVGVVACDRDGHLLEGFITRDWSREEAVEWATRVFSGAFDDKVLRVEGFEMVEL